MKILMLGWELPPHNSGGLGVACWGLAKALSDKGMNITFVLPYKMNVKADFMNVVFADLKESADVRVGAYNTSWTNYKGEHVWGVPGNNFVQGAHAFAQGIGAVAKKYKPDVVHSHDWMTFPAGIVAKAVKNKPLLAHVHSTEFDRTGGHYPNPEVYKIEKDGLEYADKILPVSRFTKSILVEKYGLNENKIEVVHNGVDNIEKSFIPPALTKFKEMDYKVVLFLGRITLQKGPEYFVRAARRVLDYDQKVLFVVTGSGDMMEYMMQEAVRLGVINNFIFTGFLRGKELAQIFTTADLYVMPSVSEPFGLTVLESISYGTPVLVSKQSGVSEVVQHALKVDFWDIDEMANKILGVVSHPALGVDLSRESIKELGAINWNCAADKCINVYQQLVR
jgi:glycogen synthase